MYNIFHISRRQRNTTTRGPYLRFGQQKEFSYLENEDFVLEIEVKIKEKVAKNKEHKQAKRLILCRAETVVKSNLKLHTSQVDTDQVVF